MEEIDFKKIITAMIFIGLLALTFFLLKPILLAIVFGFILAFIFSPFYDFLNRKINSANLASGIICAILVIIIVLPLWLLTPVMIDQSIKAYQFTQNEDFTSALKNFIEYLPMGSDVTSQIVTSIQSFASEQISKLDDYLINIILESPVIFFQLLVVFFTLFFALKDKNDMINYIKSLLPFSEDVKEKLLLYSKQITMGVIYGQIIVGIFQGLIVGVSLFIFGVNNALLLTLVAALAGALPVVGAALVWVPVVLYAILSGNFVAAIGVGVFGLFASTVDNFLRPYFVYRRTYINSSIILIGMIGGLLMFGVLGLILGPLILAYLLIVIEIYRDKKYGSFFTSKNVSKDKESNSL